MTREHALLIVWNMAMTLYHNHGEICLPAKSLEEAQVALDKIETELLENKEGK